MPVNEHGGTDEQLAARCARLYYLEDRSKTDIAVALSLSRFKVARLIELARTSGLVSITVRDPDSGVADLAGRLRAAYDLRDAVVVAESAGFEAAGRAGAELLVTALRPGEVVGIGWGRSVDAVVDALDEVATPVGVDVVQLAGGLDGPSTAFDPSGVAARAARTLGGSLTALHSPAFLGAAATRRALLAEPSIAAAMAAYGRVSVAVVGVGALGAEPDSALVSGDELPARARVELTARGAVSDVVCHFFDVDGAPVVSWEDRTVAIPLPELLRVPLRIGVAVQRSKATAVLAALRAGVLNALVTDATCARALLASSTPGAGGRQ